MTKTIKTGCCIVDGGPAGMMLGVLLARAGVDVVMLEKHADACRRPAVKAPPGKPHRSALD